MMPTPNAVPLLPEGATALEIPSDRPSSYDTFRNFSSLAPATAVRFVTPPSERGTSRPRSMTVYMPTPPPESIYFAKCIAYAYITPETAPGRADPVAFVRRVFRTVALDLPQTFQLVPSYYGDIAVRFRTPEDREAAMRRQPFELDGATVTLVREGETSDVVHHEYNYMAHVALRNYPVGQRNEDDIAGNCAGFGSVCEIDPACFTAPDLATVHVVLQLHDPSEIAHQVRIRYHGGYASVVPVEIVRLWHSTHSYEADGQQYVPLFQAAPAAAA
jgi:hypothetical protein